MSTLRTIGAVDRLSDADSLFAILDSQGIPCHLENVHTVAADALWANAVGGVKIQVPAEFELQAVIVYQDFVDRRREKYRQNGKLEIRFECSECTKNIAVDAIHAGGVETCPKCGAYNDVPPSTDTNTFPFATVTDPRFSYESKGWNLLEVVILLLLVWLPHFKNGFDAFLYSAYWPTHAIQFVTLESSKYLLVSSTYVIAVVGILSLVSRSGFSRIGFCRWQWKRDLGLTVLVVVFHFAVDLLTLGRTESFVFDGPIAELYGSSVGEEVQTYFIELENAWVDQRSHQLLTVLFLLFVSLIANSFAEELSMRTFLMTRLERLIPSSIAVACISSALFASYHIYQGIGSMLTIFASAIACAVVFQKWRTVYPLVLGHTIVNLIYLVPIVFEY